MRRLPVMGISTSLALWLLLAGSGSTAGSLYRCVTETEGIIYTDNPAQLERCSPITASGAVSSLATVSSGGPPTNAPPDPFPMTQAMPEPTVMMSPPGSQPLTIDPPPPSPTGNSTPCPVGMNPLNPFSAPPCPTPEAAPTATITMPTGPGMQP
jgi:hypothetical protein